MNLQELEYGMKQLEYIEKEVEEIKKLNKKSSDILNSKNIFVRIFQFNKATKLNEEASERMLRVTKRLSRLPRP
jgi:DNA integrity scanning protein DisA with diadenylate cyclase activity